MIEKLFFRVRMVAFTVLFVLAGDGAAIVEDSLQPTALAKCGELILDDDGSKDRGGKRTIEFHDGIGGWERFVLGSNSWRSTGEQAMRHPPVA